MWEVARLVQGQVARKSEHAGGLLILPERHKDGRPAKIEDFIPVERQGGMKGKLLSAYGERAGKGNQLISDMKLEKIDALRVAELDKQQYAVDLIEKRTGARVDLDALPVHDDPARHRPARHGGVRRRAVRRRLPVERRRRLDHAQGQARRPSST
jgi:DNA polymerase III alpha subunit